MLYLTALSPGGEPKWGLGAVVSWLRNSQVLRLHVGKEPLVGPPATLSLCPSPEEGARKNVPDMVPREAQAQECRQWGRGGGAWLALGGLLLRKRPWQLAPPPLFSLGLAGWLPSQFLCSSRSRGRAHGCLSTPPWSVCGCPASLSLPLCLCVYFCLLSLLPSPEFQNYNMVTPNNIPERTSPLFTAFEHSIGQGAGQKVNMGSP